MELEQKVKMYIKENGLWQAFISRKTGIDSLKLNLWLNGYRRLTFFEYELICWVLDVNTDFFSSRGYQKKEVEKRGISAVKDYKNERHVERRKLYA